MFPITTSSRHDPKEREAIDRDIRDLLNKNAIEEVSEGSHHPQFGFISPIFTVPKKDGGRRPILNLKALNSYLPKRPFKMETLSTIASMLRQGDWMTSIDLSDAFQHVSIHPSSRRFLRFVWNHRLYQYKALPFGLSLSPWIFTKLLKPLLKWARRRGIRLTAYLDDFMVMASSRELCVRHTHLVLEKMASLGWRVNLGKSTLSPSTSIEHLGMRIDSTTLCFSVPGKKVRALRRRAYHLLHQSTTSWAELTSFAGTALATQLGCVQARFQTRYILQQINAFRHSPSRTACPISPRMKGELVWWLSQLQRWNGRRVIPPPPTRMIFTDASNSGWGIVDGQTILGGHWSARETHQHINWKELMTVWKALALCHPIMPGTHLQVAVDNLSAKAYLDKFGGTRSQELNQLALRIWRHCFQNRIHLSTVFVPSIFNPADAPSRRLIKETEWRLPRHTFRQLDRIWGPHHVDLFASATTTHLPLYVSRVHDPRALWTNALARPWTHLVHLRLLIVPPWNLIPQIMTRLRDHPQPATLVTPNWPSAHWWPSLLHLATGPPIELPVDDDDGHPVLHHTTLMAWNVAHPDAAAKASRPPSPASQNASLP